MGGLVYDNSQTMHKLQDRVNYQQHGPSVNYINRVAIQQRLLVEFSCNLHIDSLLKSFTTLCNYWTLYLVVATIVELNYLLETLCHVNSYSFLLLSISFLTEGQDIQLGPRLKRYTSQAGEAWLVICTVAHLCTLVVLLFVNEVDSYVCIKGLCCGFPYDLFMQSSSIV